MGLYDNAWPTTYEEIKRFYPVWYRDVLEMDAIWRVQGRELDGVRATVEGLVNNGYILTADLPTITSLEDFLRLVPEPGQSLDERRRTVVAYVRGLEHIGAPEIRSIVSAFTAGTVEVSFHAGIIGIKTSCQESEILSLAGYLKVLYARIPTHLRLALTVEIKIPPFVNEPDGFMLRRFVLAWSFSNRRSFPPIRLDGSVPLDGSVLLNAAASSMFAFPRFTVSGETPGVRNKMGRTGIWCGFTPFSEAEKVEMPEFRARFPTPGNARGPTAFSTPCLRVSGGMGKNKQSVSRAALTVDTMYTLDGSVLLDGSRKLNADIAKEEL